ncbi:sulfotransferase [Thiohalobacter sp. IOR34]|uniref:sulfotransferase n=1 Tax=Thiohalobacter sp. IOR34 TaxID=3057176 RepID=UPI0025B2448E|nr:sulfotransferase [Thiohalobacter sp. IOR34]WJW76277.1 sulfotransferase [Thiohalobacter sp. IOR34]
MSVGFFKKAHVRLTIAKLTLFRKAGYFFIDIGDRILCEIKMNGKARRTRKKTRSNIRLARSFIAWRHLLLEFNAPQAAAFLSSLGGYGRDLPRDFEGPAGDRILVLAAHQDDETIGAGGTLILAAKAGKKIKVVYTTDGATSLNDHDKDTVVEIRKTEARAVWRRIARVEPLFLDGGNRTEFLSREVIGRLAEIIREYRPTDIFLPNMLEQVTEHRHVNEILMQAVRIRPLNKNVQIWGYNVSTTSPGTAVVDITTVAREKESVNKIWRSQNVYGDYATVCKGRDMLNAAFLKGRRPRRHKAFAETFMMFPAEEYLRLSRMFISPPPSRVEEPVVAPPNFFVVGMQKSGSFWLTALLNAHPMVCCFPERPGHIDGVAEAHLFDGMEKMTTNWPLFAKMMRRRLDYFFSDLIPAKPIEDAERLEELRQALCIRFNQYCHLQRLRSGKPVVGEKTTETCHHPELLDKYYPDALRIAILRDPRDRVVSFFFHQIRKGRLRSGSSLTDDFIQEYISRVRKDYEGLLALGGTVEVIRYEALKTEPQSELSRIFRALGVTDDPEVLKRVVEAADFKRLSEREAGEEDRSSHYRKGVTGDWVNFLSPAQASSVVDELAELTSLIEQKFEISLAAYHY